MPLLLAEPWQPTLILLSKCQTYSRFTHAQVEKKMKITTLAFRPPAFRFSTNLDQRASLDRSTPLHAALRRRSSLLTSSISRAISQAPRSKKEVHFAVFCILGWSGGSLVGVEFPPLTKSVLPWASVPPDFAFSIAALSPPLESLDNLPRAD